MARPKFSVQHFIACLNAPWEGVPGPDTMRTLEGVAYRYAVAPIEEPPFIRDEFWLYARLFRENNVEGRRRFVVNLAWIDAPGGARVLQRFPLGSVRFTATHPVQSVAWQVGRLSFAGVGRYQFRLVVRERTAWGKKSWRQVAVEHFLLERGT